MFSIAETIKDAEYDQYNGNEQIMPELEEAASLTALANQIDEISQQAGKENHHNRVVLDLRGKYHVETALLDRDDDLPILAQTIRVPIKKSETRFLWIPDTELVDDDEIPFTMYKIDKQPGSIYVQKAEGYAEEEDYRKAVYGVKIYVNTVSSNTIHNEGTLPPESKLRPEGQMSDVSAGEVSGVLASVQIR
jgi:hypothetical protein